MAETCYPQTFPFRTLTVAQLMERLAALDPAAPVIFKAPQYGAFGSGQTYGIDGAQVVRMERREQHFPPVPTIDDETGEEGMSEPYTQVWDEWAGVVIT